MSSAEDLKICRIGENQLKIASTATKEDQSNDAFCTVKQLLANSSIEDMLKMMTLMEEHFDKEENSRAVKHAITNSSLEDKVMITALMKKELDEQLSQATLFAIDEEGKKSSHNNCESCNVWNEWVHFPHVHEDL